MRIKGRTIGQLLVLGLVFICAQALEAANTDPDALWPLCGRISESPPQGWVDTDGCPLSRAGDPAYSDEPLSATFGPRPLASESNRYDFHRGVDIATPIGTPFFAITDGVVEIAGNNASYSDPLVKLRHYRPGETSCSAGGCYHSFYLHISNWVVAESDTVVKGQLLGYTGESASGFDHLHFEMRDAPEWDAFSAWQRDAIHPLSVVPYSAINNTSITFNNVDFSDPQAGVVDLTVTSNRFDLARVDLVLLDAGQQPIDQPGNTPDALGYFVAPSFWDMETWNFQYTHKDSATIPWSNFDSGGIDECPYHADHGPSYEAGLHMDRQDPLNPLEGLFNGLHIRTQKYWPSDVDDYTVDLEFLALQGPVACVQATATFVSGDTGYAEWGTCSSTGLALVRGPYLQMQTDSSIIVRWRTDLPSDSVVRYGTAEGALVSSVSVGGSRTEHEVEVTGLSANQKYFYSVGDSIAPIASGPDIHFTTAPPPGFAADTRVWVLGDSGTANANARAVRDAYKAFAGTDTADLLLMLGDNAYNDGTDAEYQAAVFDTYPAVLANTPLFSTLGNHDGHTADSATQSGPYYDIHNFPTAGEIGGLASGTEAYYSFDYANIHFICLDSYETDRSPAGAMLTWLENDLALNTQPWVIAFWHHPPYTKGSHDSDTEGQLIDMRQNALPILEAWGVDLVLSGHSHSYERSYLLDGHYGNSLSLDPVGNVLDPGDGRESGDGMYEKPDLVAAIHEGAVYAVAGSSGKKSTAPLDHPAMFVSLYSLGSMLLDIAGNRLDATFLDETGAVRDTFSIVKTPDIEPPLLTGAVAPDATHVRVDFNEALDALEAELPANYAIAGLGISSAVLVNNDRSVLLTTSTMTPEVNYTVVVNNVQDLELNTILPDSEAVFTFFDLMTTSFQDGLLPDPAYDGTRDAYIREASPDSQYGSATTLQVDGSEPSGSVTDMNIVLGWDISSIPADAIVTDAFMELVVTNPSNGTYDCHVLLRAWNQDQVTWNQAQGGSSWGAPGAAAASDRGPDLLCTVIAGSTGNLRVDFTAAGLAQVQAWVADPNSNHGIVIADPATSDGADFHSSESTATMSRPKLSVTYRVPVGPGNIDPLASFTFSCTDLDCSFTDTSADSDGSVAGWAWDFGDGATSTVQNPSHSYAAGGSYNVSLTVTDDDGATGGASNPVVVSEPPSGPTDQVAIAELSGSGSVSGAFGDTHADDDIWQAITERESGGRKDNRYSFLEWSWQFSVVPGSAVTLFANAWSSGSSDGDAFVFAWSIDNSNWTDILTVTSTLPSNLQSAPIPADGTIYIRVRDSDQTPGNRGLDTVYIDHLFIRSEDGELPEPPAAPSALSVTGTTSDSITLGWAHPESDESGFELERAPSGTGNWSLVAMPPADTTSYTDTGLSASTPYDYRLRAVNPGGESGWSNTATGNTDAPPAVTITLSAAGTVKRGNHEVKLYWGGATSATMDVVRNDVIIASTSNNGRYTDRTGNSGSAVYVYKVCESGTNTCSNEEVVTF